MKKISIILSILILISCEQIDRKNTSKNNVEIQLLKTELEKLTLENDSIKKLLIPINEKEFKNENFNKFFFKFMTDSIFQLNRIKFPVDYVTWKDEMGGKIDTLKLKINDWKYDSFYFDYANERTQIYDNFELIFHPTNERVLHWYGIESGGDAKYYFSGYDGKWFLIRKEQLGD